MRFFIIIFFLFKTSQSPQYKSVPNLSHHINLISNGHVSKNSLSYISSPKFSEKLEIEPSYEKHWYTTQYETLVFKVRWRRLIVQ